MLTDQAVPGDHIDRLYRAAWCLDGTPEGAEELVQDAFNLVLRRHRYIDPEADLWFLCRALRDAYVGSRRLGSRGLLPAMEPAGQPDAAAVYGQIAQLPSSLRDAVIATDVVGLTVEETKKAFGIRPGALQRRLRDAHLVLRSRLIT